MPSPKTGDHLRIAEDTSKAVDHCGNQTSNEVEHLTDLSKIVKSHDTGVTLTEFHLFPELPAELRIKIWAAFLEEGRTLEIVGGALPWSNMPDNGFDRQYHVAKSSCGAPAILSVNQEARVEGLKVYTLTNLEHQDDPACLRQFYFNPLVDTVYFGRQTDGKVIQMMFNQNTAVRKIAVDYSWRPHIMVIALLGPAIRTIEELVFIIPSHLWSLRSNINPTSCLISTESTGLGQPARHDYAVVRKYVDLWIYNDENSSENLPTLNFKSFSPIPEPGKTYYIITIICRVSDEAYQVFVADVEKKTGCIIVQDHRSQMVWRNNGWLPEYEVGFYGAPRQVEEAKKMIEDEFKQESDEADLAAQYSLFADPPW